MSALFNLFAITASILLAGLLYLHSRRSVEPRRAWQALNPDGHLMGSFDQHEQMPTFVARALDQSQRWWEPALALLTAVAAVLAVVLST